MAHSLAVRLRLLPDHSDLPLFDRPFYQRLNRARMDHLAGLGLPLEGRTVIDVGSGPGHLSEFFAERGCEVMCVDGREENIEELRRLYPDRRAAVVDVETDALGECGRFDVVFCYGLLYHLADPLGFLRRAAAICDELILIETAIADSAKPLLRLVVEDANETQALNRFGCRPSSSYVAVGLRIAGFEHVYRPRALPDHKEFRYRRLGRGADMRFGRLMRDVLIGSRTPLDNPHLEPVELPR